MALRIIGLLMFCLPWQKRKGMQTFDLIIIPDLTILIFPDFDVPTIFIMY